MSKNAKDLSLRENLAFTTVRMECEYGSGDRGSGTGFFYNCSTVQGQAMIVLVTNRHVIKDVKKVNLCLTRRTEDDQILLGQIADVELVDVEWVGHPDPAVDLCACCLSRLFDRMATEGNFFMFRMFPSHSIASREEMESMFALEQIVTVGYPIGISDVSNNMPIFRRGVAATHPSMDYEGRREFLIDAACYLGCSGSPVLLYDYGMKLKGDEWIKFTGGGERIRLLGILYAVHVQSVEGKVEAIEIPTSTGSIVDSEVSIHLGVVVMTNFDDDCVTEPYWT